MTDVASQELPKENWQATPNLYVQADRLEVMARQIEFMAPYEAMNLRNKAANLRNKAAALKAASASGNPTVQVAAQADAVSALNEAKAAEQTAAAKAPAASAPTPAPSPAAAPTPYMAPPFEWTARAPRESKLGPMLSPTMFTARPAEGGISTRTILMVAGGLALLGISVWAFTR